MRADMSKVLVERPRLDSRNRTRTRKGYRNQLHREMQTGNTRQREPIREHCLGGPLFGEHLGPLRRYIDSQVGRPWANVYSEISQHIDQGNVVQKHILTHLYQYVERDVDLIDGIPYYRATRYWKQLRRIEGRNQWYVCPKTGILKRAPKRSKRSRNQTDKHQLHLWIRSDVMVRQLDDGSWQWIEVQPIRDFMLKANKVVDVLLGIDISVEPGKLKQFYGKAVYAVAYCTLHKSELGQLPIPIDLLRPKLKLPNIVR